MSSAEHPMAVVMLLLIHCLLLPPLCVRACVRACVCACACVWFVVFLFSSFAIISLGMKVSWLLYFNCLLMSFDS